VGLEGLLVPVDLLVLWPRLLQWLLVDLVLPVDLLVPEDLPDLLLL
jgi:hypothetical protein